MKQEYNFWIKFKKEHDIENSKKIHYSNLMMDKGILNNENGV